MKNSDHENLGFFDKLRLDVERILVLGDTNNKGGIAGLKETLSKRPIPERELLTIALEMIAGRLPGSLNNRLHALAFTYAPLDIPYFNGNNYRLLERIGAGGVNTVYLLNTREGNSWAMGIRKEYFLTLAQAQAYAKEQETDYTDVKKIYSTQKNLIPEEFRVIYETHSGYPNVMFFRKFVPGPIKDIFSYNNKGLVELLQRNNKLRGQLSEFVNTSTKNMRWIAQNNLDLLGTNNLVIAGDMGTENLVLLEPHTLDSYKTEEKGDIIKERIEGLGNVRLN